MQVLIIDNSVMIIQRLEELLSDAPVIPVIHRALSYREALRMFEEYRPDAVVLDINLPENASYILLKKIKEEAPETLVIILSIHIDEYIRQQCMIPGADFFFDKYNEFEKIPEIIHAFNLKTVSS